MFRNMRRLFQYWKSTLFDNEQIKPTVYKVGNKKYVKVKRLRIKSRSKGPYIK